MAKTLIAFFSRRGENWVDGGVRFLPKGNNEVIVEKIKAQLPEADVFRIETVRKYSDDYMVCIEEAKQELRAKARPELTASAQTLVVYYSKPGETYTKGGIINLKKGNTREVAERIQKLGKADIFRVETVKNYPDSYT